MEKIRFATVWLAGCSGCHMSFLDLDEWLIELSEKVEVVYSPVGCDLKEYPENVDVCLVEGGIANEDNLELIKEVRSRTKLLISFGDCAVTANVPAMRNMLGSTDHVLKRCYLELGDFTPQLPREPGIVPELLERVTPVHEVVDVDIFMPGCPPSADRIKATLAPLVEGKMPKMEGREMIKFG
ncbi:MAG: oxidoreductase [Limnospira sp. PMC 1291.21]|uniref:NADH ubiquinone oxidoreductase 20 kDa subunit n=2 Tax=Limnospira TaxID=2596745 RepID=B5W0T9_LIMMA|nr:MULTISPECIES: oxidoreductase [Limnospira]EKD08055.1 NADH ubiquinone oxidoreductase 20 kDa subunit [Arthrospira platensis C1]MDC0836308.1 oxidoreductase [Limnoraphis robusta]MDY7054102.1 oxidoreductase [Limnospira fusiformis LS22]QJB25358.1 oxidoreductase [Limnospira fusiformis SAG 85.79]EDZ94739.1 NADH ubiquinone oxidoreductase 20 kDa subunit [Limnospira maxima CS-328]